MQCTNVRGICLVSLAALLAAAAPARGEFQFGFARRDATPQVPLRLSGYGNRDKPSEGVDVPLHVRAMALRHADGPVHVLLSIDSIGFTGGFVQEVLQQVERQHGVSRSRLAVCATHSHTSPQLARGLENLFAVPLTDAERQAATTYTDQLRDACIATVGDAIADLKPGRLQLVQGTATFAVNRRVLKDGVWTGFGNNADGPVDHRLPVLVVTAPNGETIRGLVFNYACHCTTFGGEYNRVNGDWAGYAAEYLEAAHPGCVALCTIGCGADQNPERDSKRAFEIAQMQGRQIADETARLVNDATRIDITAPPVASFGFAGLPIDRPTVDDLKKAVEDKRPQVKRHAEVMLDTHARMGRLPESYPMPVQVWRFGDEFAMVFLGGEVCVDYEYRIRRELEPKLKPSISDADSAPSRIFVTAYANDVFGYVAPERMRAEGGYEVDFSMIYYLQPGRWSTGTEDVILRRVHELFEQPGGGEALSVNEALRTFTLPEGLAIDVVAAEPLIRDPVNMAVDQHGRLWVVEMGDYPRGAPDENGWSPGRSAEGKPWDGPAGGRIRILTDTNGDGRYDQGVTFLEGLSFPTGVFPWRDSVIVCCSPDIFLARDSDGDGRCDHREVLYTGFVQDNPQHRVNGFEYGLDGWLYLASGASSSDITCVKTGEVVNISGRDLRIHPDSGRLEPVSGRSQYGRSRDDFGNWYGNTNSEPLFQFVIEDRQLRRNPYVATPSPRPLLSGTGRATPVYPTSRTVDRFNDMYAANRFTSACAPQVFRDETLGSEVAESVFICEPVHNLVSRLHVTRGGPQFTAERFPREAQSEFLRSTDPWFRPVRLMTGPDGALWLCDMYRQVIEHPQWIPEAWQARINLSAGADRGRIYCLHRNGERPKGTPDLAAYSSIDLVKHLASSNAWHRDTAQRLLTERGDATVVPSMLALATTASSPAVRTQALWTLIAIQPQLRHDVALRAQFLGSADPELVIQGLRALGLVATTDTQAAVGRLCQHPELRVRYELALAAGDLSDAAARAGILSELALRDLAEPWMRTAILSSAVGVAPEMLRDVLAKSPPSAGRQALLEGLIATALGDRPEVGAGAVLQAIAPAPNDAIEDWQLTALGVCLDGLARKKQTLQTMHRFEDSSLARTLIQVGRIFDSARLRVEDAAAPPAALAAATQLLGRRSEHLDAERSLLASLLTPQQPPEVQVAAIERLAALNSAEPLLESLSRLGPAQQGVIETALLQNATMTQALLQSLAGGTLEPRRLSAATRSALTNHRDVAVKTAAAKVLGDSTASSAANVVARLERVSPLMGDISRGRIVFEKRCSTCHRHSELGNEIGPKLGTLTNKSTEYLLTAILDTNRAVDAKYRSCNILLTDGRQQTGLISEETATNVMLVTSDGRKQTILRRDIEDLMLTGLSFMPEGIDKDLSDQDLADVIRFVQQAD